VATIFGEDVKDPQRYGVAVRESWAVIASEESPSIESS